MGRLVRRAGARFVEVFDQAHDGPATLRKRIVNLRHERAHEEETASCRAQDVLRRRGVGHRLGIEPTPLITNFRFKGVGAQRHRQENPFASILLVAVLDRIDEALADRHRDVVNSVFVQSSRSRSAIDEGLNRFEKVESTLEVERNRFRGLGHSGSENKQKGRFRPCDVEEQRERCGLSGGQYNAKRLMNAATSAQAIPFAFVLFAATLVGIAVFHKHTLRVALVGLSAIVATRVFVDGVSLVQHLGHEWSTLVNLFLLLTGFAVLADQFDRSRVPSALPAYLPDGWWGAFTLLFAVFVLSSFLDNIAAAMVGGTIALAVFERVHLGYVAAIVAASNAGGAGSVIGDTTTTMMWIEGVKPLEVFHAYVGSVVALCLVGMWASTQQTRLAPIAPDPKGVVTIDWPRLGVVGFVMGAAIVMNLWMNTRHRELAESFPLLGVAVWFALLASSWVRTANWGTARAAVPGSLFLISLVLAASLMPVAALPAASWQTALALGFISAVFDNIPLTKLALTQGGYDWGVLAYSVGFGGSMIWFGSSAGVAISQMFPEAKSVGRWLQAGWIVTAGFVAGFTALYALAGWNPGSE